jgi:hypothetical protein
MNNTANGGRKCKGYVKDGQDVYVRFVIVNNRRTLTTYCNVWVGDAKLGQTYDVQYKDIATTMIRAEKLLESKGYAKI